MIYTTDKPLGQTPQATDRITSEGLHIADETKRLCPQSDFTTVRDQLSQLGIKALYRSIQSDNYVKGSAGWKLGADGIIEGVGASLSGSFVITGGSGISKLSDAGDLATLDIVEKAKLGSTVVSGGYLKTDMLDTSVAYISQSAMIANAVITNAHIGEVLTVGNTEAKCTDPNADQTSANTAADSNKIQGYTAISGGKIVADLLTASNIQTGTLDASQVNVTNLNADNITTGTLTGKTVRTDTSGNFRLEMRDTGETTYPNQLVWVDNNNNDIAKITCDSSGDIVIGPLNNAGTVRMYTDAWEVKIDGHLLPYNYTDIGANDSYDKWRDLWLGRDAHIDEDIYVGGDIHTTGGSCILGTTTPYSDNNYDLGSSGARWRNMYINGTIFMGSNGFLSLPQISGSDANNIPAQNGAMYYRTDDNVIRAYLNGAWVTVSTS